MQESELVKLVVQAAIDTKAEDILVYDMQGRSSITDYVVICSGRSQGHVRGISENIEEALRKADRRPDSLEGLQEGSWVLMDFDVALVHIFHPETRSYYDLESLLADFPCQEITEEETPPGEVRNKASAGI